VPAKAATFQPPIDIAIKYAPSLPLSLEVSDLAYFGKKSHTPGGALVEVADNALPASLLRKILHAFRSPSEFWSGPGAHHLNDVDPVSFFESWDENEGKNNDTVRSIISSAAKLLWDCTQERHKKTRRSSPSGVEWSIRLSREVSGNKLSGFPGRRLGVLLDRGSHLNEKAPSQQYPRGPIMAGYVNFVQ